MTESSYVPLPTWSDEVERREADFRGYQRYVLSKVRRLIQSGRLLDIGCSTGLLVDEATNMGFDACGIDLDPHAIELGARAGRQIHLAELATWMHYDYKLIILSHTLEHIRYPQTFLRLCIEHLARDGYICIAVPCLSGLLPRVAPRWWYGWMVSQHYYHYTVAGLDALFKQVGLAMVWQGQSTMDHRIRAWPRRWQDQLKSVACASLGWAGSVPGLGDQLIAIARRG